MSGTDRHTETWALFWALIRYPEFPDNCLDLTRRPSCEILERMFEIAAGVILGLLGFAALVGLCIGLLLLWAIWYEARQSRRAVKPRETVRTE